MQTVFQPDAKPETVILEPIYWTFKKGSFSTPDETLALCVVHGKTSIY